MLKITDPSALPNLAKNLPKEVIKFIDKYSKNDKFLVEKNFLDYFNVYEIFGMNKEELDSMFKLLEKYNLFNPKLLIENRNHDTYFTFYDPVEEYDEYTYGNYGGERIVKDLFEKKEGEITKNDLIELFAELAGNNEKHIKFKDLKKTFDKYNKKKEFEIFLEICYNPKPYRKIILKHKYVKQDPFGNYYEHYLDDFDDKED